MSESPKAVFLSYASQDAEAAKKICDALRATGIEVWFDQNELVGGDSWDQKIRGQIKACALFVPLVSAATNARREGYFRREWKLAVDRTHDMDEALPFLLPVVIDATTDAGAFVPEKFREVQWTRLPGGETPPKFCERVKKLLGGEAGSGSREAFGPGHETPVRSATRQNRPSSRPWVVPAIVGTALLVAVAAYFALRPRRSPEEVAKLIAMAESLAEQAGAKSAPAPVVATSVRASASTEAAALVARAKAIYTKFIYTRDDLGVADELARKATEQEPESAATWGVRAGVGATYIYRNWDLSDKRRQETQAFASRALGLDPDEPEALLALGHVLQKQGAPVQAEANFRRAFALDPRSNRFARALSLAVAAQGRRAEAMAMLEEAVARDPRDPLVHYDLASYYGGFANPRPDAEAIAKILEHLDAGIAAQPLSSLLLMKAAVLGGWRGDLPAMHATLAQLDALPTTERTDDRAVYFTMWAGLLEHDARSVEAAAGVTAKNYFEDTFVTRRPKDWSLALAHRMAGKENIARLDWQRAESVLRSRLRDDSNNQGLQIELATTLAWLGQTDEAIREVASIEGAWREDLSLSRARNLAQFYAALGDVAGAAPYLSRALDSHAFFSRQVVRLDPWWDKVRGSPEFEALLAEPKKEPVTATAVAPDDKSVAVLAFADLSAAHDSEYFSDGISEDLLNVLAKVPGLKVTARTSSFFFKGKNLPIPEIAAKLGVAYVIEGSVQRAGDNVRITAQLIKAADGFHVWSDHFDRELKNVFALQDEIAGLIAQNLSLKLGASSVASIVAVNPQAFELYVQARSAWNLRNDGGFARAEQLLNRALELAPDFARAHAALADVWYFQAVTHGIGATFGRPDPPEFARALAEVRQALALDPDSAEAHASLALILNGSLKFTEAEREFRRAIALNPNYASAHQWLGGVVGYDGRMDEALAELKLASELDPLSSRIADNYAYGLYTAGRYSAALAMNDRAIALQPSNVQAVGQKPVLLAYMGRAAEAAALARELPPAYEYTPVLQLVAYAKAGFRSEAAALLPAAKGLGFYHPSYLLLLLGRKEEAIASLDLNSCDGPQTFILADYDALDGDPRFQKFIAAIGWTEARARLKAWRAAHPPEKPAERK